MRCDASGQICWCQQCGQVHSPLWSARKSKILHRLGNPGHRVVVVGGAKAAALVLALADEEGSR